MKGKRLWSYKRTDQIGVPSLVHDDNVHIDSLTKSNILYYFILVFTKEDTTSIPTLGSQPCLDTDPLVVNSGIIQLLKDLDQYKSGGPDGLPARFLKEMANQIAPAFVLIYQASFNQGVLPDD